MRTDAPRKPSEVGLIGSNDKGGTLLCGTIITDKTQALQRKLNASRLDLSLDFHVGLPLSSGSIYMAKSERFLQYSTHAGQSIEKGDLVVTPISGALRLNLPFFNYVWNRPVAIVVEEGDSSEKLPIMDATLLAQVALFSVALAATILTVLVTKASKKRKM